MSGRVTPLSYGHWLVGDETASLFPGMELLEAGGLIAAAFAAGAINSVAGGGSLVSFPALVAAGYGTKAANVTNAVALLPGYFGSTLGYRTELYGQRQRVIGMSIPGVLGALAGSAILLLTPDSAFDVIIPFLIIFACVLLMLQERLAAFAAAHRSEGGRDFPLSLSLVVFFLAVYGAYFGAGLGIITLAVLGILMPDDIQRSNALKGWLAFLVNLLASAIFAVFGPVEWLPAAVMMLAALTGGYLGVSLARRLGKKWLRRAVVVYGFAFAVVLLARL